MSARDGLRVALPAFAAAKLVTVAAMLLSLQHATGTVGWSQLLEGFRHWDAISYLDIAGHGYPAHLDYHDAFLPAYPLLMRVAARVVGDLVTAGLLVSALAQVAALIAIALLVARERDRATARFAVWAVALAPMAFFFSAVYTESAFVAAAAWSLLRLRQGRPAAAALAGALACSLRITGIVLVPVMVIELLARRGGRRRDLAWAAVIPVPLLLYAAYMQLRTGDALALLHAQALPSFGQAAAWPWDGLRVTWQTAVASADAANRAIFQREVAFGILGLVLVIACWLDARFPRSLAVYCSLAWVVAVSISFWRSVPRYELALFPAVIVIADATARIRRVRPALLTTGAAGLAWGAWVFAEGAWIG